jgi:hypothetical protein
MEKLLGYEVVAASNFWCQILAWLRPISSMKLRGSFEWKMLVAQALQRPYVREKAALETVASAHKTQRNKQLSMIWTYAIRVAFLPYSVIVATSTLGELHPLVFGFAGLGGSAPLTSRTSA